ncbi:MAG: hypothetical protein M0P09_08925, partial [Acholeplasmataceae bacterium]|nr:hypothetical protein [Acholeplasmataceae bacterium]
NVFDIQQGVSINIFVKTGKKKANELGKVFHYDLFGKREMKYDFLSENSLRDVEFKELAYNKPYYFFVPKDDLGRELYEKGFKVSEVFENFTSGMVTANDKLSVFKTIKELNETTDNILTSENPYTEFKIKDSRRVSKEGRLDDLRNARAKGVMKVHFRPFDFNYMYQFDKNEHWINSPRNDVMQHFVKGNNIGLVVARQCADDWKYVLCTKYANDFNLTGTAGRYGSGYTFPLYIYPETNGQQTIEQDSERKPNLKAEIVNQIAVNLGLTFTNEKETTENTFAPIDILDYIYAVLHPPTYREKYKEFLKIDFPRVPYPKDQDTFWQLVKLGGEIRQIHLLESPTVEQYITQYPIDGDNFVNRKITKSSPGYVADNETYGKVYINDHQYFDKVPLVAWEFYIGGYQPAQKWLKDRKGRKLEFDDILHYQKIIVALTETDRLMKEIEKLKIE